MNNKMEDVAKLLGVELGEEFEIKDDIFGPHKLTKEGLFDCEGNEEIYMLHKLMLGMSEIVKPLLTKEEKEYLENFLRPYKKNIEKISMYHGVRSYLEITIKRVTIQEKIALPYILEDDLQFKGLETDEYYTLQELKLFEGE